MEMKPNAEMVIKSTISVGYNLSLCVKYAKKFKNPPALAGKEFNLLLSPEFLHESKTLYDYPYPSRIIVGITELKNGIYFLGSKVVNNLKEFKKTESSHHNQPLRLVSE